MQLITITIKVKARAKTRAITSAPDGSLIVSTNAVPAEGQANDDVIAMIAERYGVSRSCVTIKRGHRSARKTIQILA